MWRRRRNHMHNLSVFALWKPTCTRTVKANIITSPAEANVLCECTVGKKVYHCAVIKTQWANFSSRISCPQSTSWYNESITKTPIWYIIVEDGELHSIEYLHSIESLLTLEYGMTTILQGHYMSKMGLNNVLQCVSVCIRALRNPDNNSDLLSSNILLCTLNFDEQLHIILAEVYSRHV